MSFQEVKTDDDNIAIPEVSSLISSSIKLCKELQYSKEFPMESWNTNKQ
jgi:hypothetical protein